MKFALALARPLLPLLILSILASGRVISAETGYLCATGYVWMLLLRESARTPMHKVFLILGPLMTFTYAADIDLLTARQASIFVIAWLVFCFISILVRKEA